MEPVSKDGLGRSVVSGFGREWNILQTIGPLLSILSGFDLGIQTKNFCRSLGRRMGFDIFSVAW